MSKILKGAVVTIGSGKVLYTVLSDVVTAEAHIESQNTGKAQTVDASRLNVVSPVLSDEQIEELNETHADYGFAAAQELKANIVSDIRTRVNNKRHIKSLKLRKGKRGGKLRVS